MKRTVCVILAALLCAAMLAECGGYGGVLRANWGLRLPENREVYASDSGESFFGDGVRYHVFACDAEKLKPWRGAEEPPDRIMQATALLDELEVPAEHRPDWERCAVWYAAGENDQRDELLLFWNREAGLLYVLEQFM